MRARKATAEECMVGMNPERDVAICVAAQRPDATLRGLAEVYGITWERVRQVLRREGIRLPRKGPPLRLICPRCGKPVRNRKYCSDNCRRGYVNGQRQCYRCGEWKPLGDFHPIYGKPGLYRPDCKPCYHAFQYARARARALDT